MFEHWLYALLFPNEKHYVGQTIDLKARMYNHKKKASSGKYKTPVYNAIRKYGWENIKLVKLVRCKVEDVDELERLYITRFKTLERAYGYNLDTGGVLNKNHSHSTRVKISKANRSKSVHTFRTRTKRIAKYTLDGILVAVYESASEAARIHGVAANTISRVARGGRKTSCKHRWEWLEDSV